MSERWTNVCSVGSRRVFVNTDESQASQQEHPLTGFMPKRPNLSKPLTRCALHVQVVTKRFYLCKVELKIHILRLNYYAVVL